VVEVLGLELLRLLVVVVVVRASDGLKGLSAEGKRQHWLDCCMFLRTNRTVIRENSAIFLEYKKPPLAQN
jgi:hypothetical protein